jgi:hypothetical protein
MNELLSGFGWSVAVFALMVACSRRDWPWNWLKQ